MGGGGGYIAVQGKTLCEDSFSLSFSPPLSPCPSPLSHFKITTKGIDILCLSLQSGLFAIINDYQEGRDGETLSK